MRNSGESDRSNHEVTIIGAGIVGICCAVYLQEQGCSVRVVDRLSPGEACSYGNAGVLSSWSCIPDSMPGILKSVPRWLLDPEGPLSIRWSHLPQCLPWIMKFIRAGRGKQLQEISDGMFALNNPTLDLYRDLTSRAGGQELIVPSSYLHLFKTVAEAERHERSWKMRRERGAEITFITGQQIQEIEPSISYDYQTAVMISPQGHTTNPSRLVKVLFKYFQKLGGTFVQANVLEFKPETNAPTRLITSVGELVADRLVIATGAWSREISMKFGCRIPIQPQGGYHVTFANPGVQLDNAIMEPNHKIVMTSMEAGLRIAGMAEFSSVEAEPNPHYKQVLTRIAKRILPNLDIENGLEWMGHRPCTPDTLPIIGAVPCFSNVFFAFGHGHHGLTGAPMTGRIIAALMTGQTAPINLAPYRADRF